MFASPAAERNTRPRASHGGRDWRSERARRPTVAKVFQGRYSADLEGDFVVFLIGMRINKPWDVRG
jgi:hypothetical protein